MVYRRKPVSVLTLKLPNGNFRVTDTYGKIEELTPLDFARYVESVISNGPSEATVSLNEVKKIHEALLEGDVEGALQLTESLL